MARKLMELEYEEMKFFVYQAGGTDGMEAFMSLVRGALPAVSEMLRKVGDLKQLLASPTFRKQVRAMTRLFTGSEAAPIEAQKDVPADGPATLEAAKGQSIENLLGLDLSSITGIIEAVGKLTNSLTEQERDSLRQRLLFSGSVEVVYVDSNEGGKKSKDKLTRELWDDLFAGDPLGSWFVFGMVIKHNVGKFTPAIAAIRKSVEAGKTK